MLDDLNHYPRATASYEDSHGSKTLEIVSVNAVLAAPAGLNNRPVFDEGSSASRSLSENPGGVVNVGAAVTASDADNETLTYALEGTDADSFDIDQASAQISIKGGATYDYEATDSYSVEVTATDSSGASNAAASIDITINLQNVNEAPVANGDTVTIDEDTPITIDVLDKDSDPDANDTLTVSGTQRPTHGEATVGPDNTITYTPDLHFDDSDSFTYRVTDMEGLFDEAEVGVIITMVNDTPEFVGVFERRVAIGAAVGTEVGAPIAATDPDGDPLTYEHSGKDATSLLIDENSGQLTVNAALEATAADAPLVVTVTATDPDMEEASIEVTITVTAGRPTGTGGGAPSEADFEWTVTGDIEALDGEHDLPTGIWSDGATVWVADSGQDRLFAYDLNTGERIEEMELELHEENRDPRDIWSDGETIYVLDSVQDALFAYQLETGEFVAQHALDKLNGSPRGIWSDGFTWWVSDDGAKRLFAYRIEGGSLSRVEAEEFTFRSLLKAGNGDARGIWPDGEVVDVADEQDDHVYTYNLPDAIDARLASLSLSGVELDECSPRRSEYDGSPNDGVTETTVAATAVQASATVVIEPPDADADAEHGHQASVEHGQEITVTVTSADSSRRRVYRVRFDAPVAAETEAVNELGPVSGQAALSMAEGQSGRLAQYTVSDPEGDALRWSLVGPDGGHFGIDQEGTLTLSRPLDFEAPLSADGGNLYRLSVVATDDGEPPATSSREPADAVHRARPRAGRSPPTPGPLALAGVPAHPPAGGGFPPADGPGAPRRDRALALCRSRPRPAGASALRRGWGAHHPDGGVLGRCRG